MNRTLNRAARYAAPALFIVGGVLASGAVVTAIGQPAIGWTLYGIGYIGAFATVAIFAGPRLASLSWFGRIAAAVLLAGIVMGTPKLLMVWGLYTGTAAIHDVFMPYATSPILMLSGMVAWAGVLLAGTSMTLGRRLPHVGLPMIVAALMALAFELRLAPQIVWVAALLILAAAFASMAFQTQRRGRSPLTARQPAAAAP